MLRPALSLIRIFDSDLFASSNNSPFCTSHIANLPRSIVVATSSAPSNFVIATSSETRNWNSKKLLEDKLLQQQASHFSVRGDMDVTIANIAYLDSKLDRTSHYIRLHGVLPCDQDNDEIGSQSLC